MNLKTISTLLFLLFLDVCNLKASTVTNFVISSSNIVGTPAIANSLVVNLNATGTTTITTTVTISKTADEQFSYVFSLGTVTNSGALFAFGGTVTFNEWFNVEGHTTAGIQFTSTIDPTQPINNKLDLLVSTDGGSTYTLYTGPNKYIVNQPVTTQPFYRYVNEVTGFHFYTMNPSELNGNNSWHYESEQGQPYLFQVSGTLPLYRYSNSASGDHFYTLTQGSYSGYALECDAAFVYTTQVGSSIPLYQYYSSTLGHFYTTNYNELGAGGGGYTYNGIACYVNPNP